MRWLFKTEPKDYCYDDLAADGQTAWDGVRGHQARAALQKTRPGDEVLVYHTGRRPQVVGLAEVVRGPYPDPDDPSGVLVDIAARGKLPNPVTLAEIKKQCRFERWALVRQPRLSVLEVPAGAWDWIIARAGR